MPRKLSRREQREQEAYERQSEALDTQPATNPSFDDDSHSTIGIAWKLAGEEKKSQEVSMKTSIGSHLKAHIASPPGHGFSCAISGRATTVCPNLQADIDVLFSLLTESPSSVKAYWTNCAEKRNPHSGTSGADTVEESCIEFERERQ